MSGFQSPQLLTDLYRDLRDRRLLPLVLVLVVGLAVVPMALSSKAKNAPAPAPQPPLPVAKKSKVPSTQVVVSNPSLRDFRDRLKGDSPKDPFVQLFPPPPSGDAAGSSAASAASPSSSSADTTATTPPTTTTSPPSGGSTGSQPTTGSSSPSETKLVNYRVKIRTGQVGSELKVQDEVGPLWSLPGGSVAALAFIGVTMDSDLNPKRAFFLVSNNATVVGGDSACVVGSPCQVLTLKLDQYVDVTWTDRLTYRVKLLKFRRHIRDRPPAQLGNQTDVASSG
jgi:hypothetical protein